MIYVTYVLDSFSVLSPDFARVRMIPGVRRFLFLLQSSKPPPNYAWCGGGEGPQDDGLFQLLECQLSNGRAGGADLKYVCTNQGLAAPPAMMPVIFWVPWWYKYLWQLQCNRQVFHIGFDIVVVVVDQDQDQDKASILAISQFFLGRESVLSPGGTRSRPRATLSPPKSR